VLKADAPRAVVLVQNLASENGDPDLLAEVVRSGDRNF
jgi:hypothetical protein